jgi:type IV pilus assembly protein PilE
MVYRVRRLSQNIHKHNHAVPAFTLSELLVVLVIIGILVLLALPKFMPLISKTRSVEAKQALKFVHTLERTYFFEHARYSNDLRSIHFEQEKLATEDDGGSANYLIEIVEASPSSFVARATAVVDFDGDGEFNVWEINDRGDLTEVKND